jgi:antitoxin component YwqK of YwqJK toxin-antitoxin module
MEGYKLCTDIETGKERLIVTLEILGKTNTDRTNVNNKLTAKYRTSKVKVLQIENDKGELFTEAVSSIHKKQIIYKVNEEIICIDYDEIVDNICSTGIHFFLTKRVAELYGLSKIENGIYECWYENGQLENSCTYVDGKPSGLYQTWYENGQLKSSYTYVDGKLNGLSQIWHENGQLNNSCTYNYGRLSGLSQIWYENGQLESSYTYVDGKLSGLFQIWYENGQLESSYTYVDGKLSGLFSNMV